MLVYFLEYTALQAKIRIARAISSVNRHTRYVCHGIMPSLNLLRKRKKN